MQEINDLLDANILQKHKSQEKRNYLGASMLGDECVRKIQLQYMKREIDFSAQNLRTFAIGNCLEDLMADWIILAGFDLRTKDENDNLVSLQKIFFNGREGKFIKKFHRGSRTKGCFFVLGEIRDELVICEGYATGASIYECVEKPVVVAFSSGGLCDVAKTMRKKYPAAKITIAADNDQFNEDGYNPGLTKAKEAAVAIKACVVIPEFLDKSEKPTDFNDLLILEGAEKVREIFAKSQEENSICESMVDGFRLTENALSYYDERRKDYVYVSGCIKVIAQTEDSDGENTGKLIEVRTRRGQIRRLRIHNYWLAKDGDKMRELLLKIGFKISTNHKAKLMLNEYINNCDPPVYAKFVRISGWYGNGFLTENGYVGSDDAKELIFHQSEAEPTGVEVKGNLEEWKENVSKYCPGNSRLILAVSAAFASILLKPCDRENFGIHFVGGSSEGKTTTLYAAASVFGSREYIQSWRSTDNGLEGLAVTHNDMLLILDEIGEMDSKKIGDSVYMLANGKGKTRANVYGAARKKSRWKMGILSTGEVSLESRMAEANKKINAGQQIRLLHINAKPTMESLGILEELHGFNSTSDLAAYLKEASEKYYGSAMVEFIKKALEEKHLIKKNFDEALARTKSERLPVGACGQDDRVFGILFTVGFAGELATRYGITGWPVGEALTAAIKCFDEWLETKGGVGSQEDRQMLAQIKYFFETYGQSRFQRMANHKTFDNSYMGERAGFVEARQNESNVSEDVYYVFPEYFKNIIAKGLRLKVVAKLLIDLKIMEPENDSATARPYINEKRQRMYVINSRIFN
jgi:putative DNA primase/helicase